MDSSSAQTSLAMAIGTSLDLNAMSKQFLRELKHVKGVLACGLLIPDTRDSNQPVALFAGEVGDTLRLSTTLKKNAAGSAGSHTVINDTVCDNDEIIGFPLGAESGSLFLLCAYDASTGLRQAIEPLKNKLAVAITGCLEHQQLIAERQATQHRLSLEEDQNTRSHLHIQSIDCPILRTDPDGRIIEINEAAESLLLMDISEARQHTLTSLLKALSQPGERVETTALLDAALRHNQPWKSHSIIKLQNRDGKRLCIKLSSSPHRGPLKNAPEGHIVTLNDVTRSELMELRATWQASHDAVTHLLNRAGFEAKLHEHFEENATSGQTHALLHMDVDQFKVINDTCGHAAGDNLLQQVAMLIRKEIRDSDILGRLGGDEFGVILSFSGPTKAQKIADHICKSVAQYRFAWRERVFNPTISIGLTNFDPASTSPADAMKQADLACFSAKDSGRNNVYVYRHEKGEFASRRGEEMEWVSRITRAIETNRLTLFCQSIYPLKTQDPVHIEMLVRMIEGDQLILPGAFLPAAERFGKIQALDRWVVVNTVQQISANPSLLNGQFRFNINLAGPSVSDDATQKFILKLLREQPQIAQLLNFEITETAAISNLSSCIQFIDTCKTLGTQFALDDFGTGLSSFVYLKQLPVSQIKIDGTFVRDICFDPVDEAMVTAIQQIAVSLGIKTVAEFVEDQATVEAIRDIGIDYAQGYGLELPLPLADKIQQLTHMCEAKIA